VGANSGMDVGIGASPLDGRGRTELAGWWLTQMGATAYDGGWLRFGYLPSVQAAAAWGTDARRSSISPTDHRCGSGN
jgi:hypothetical protein